MLTRKSDVTSLPPAKRRRNKNAAATTVEATGASSSLSRSFSSLDLSSSLEVASDSVTASGSIDDELFLESQAPYEYLYGDQHPVECGCHWCHKIYGNPQWTDDFYFQLIRKSEQLGEGDSPEAESQPQA